MKHKKPLIYALIPARSGSKGFPDKNIKSLAGKPLIKYSIDFAKSLEIDRIICSTDSEHYADIAIQHGAEVPFLRSKEAASDDAMEEDVLQDLRDQFCNYTIPEPNLMVWLRPTFIFRDRDAVLYGLQTLVNNPEYSSARTVVESEGRLYKIDPETKTLYPTFDDSGKSMIRRQDIGKFYKVFSTDILRFKSSDLNSDFLGRNIFPIEVNKICGLDIDDQVDFDLVESLVKNTKSLVKQYLC